MRIHKLEELYEIRQQRRIKVKDLANENLTYSPITECTAVEPCGIIVLPNSIALTEQNKNKIAETINAYAIEHLLMDKDIRFNIEVNCLCGDYINQETSFNKDSVCVIFYATLADSEHLKQIAMYLMQTFIINRIVILTDSPTLASIEIEKTEEMGEGRIKRLDEI